MKDLWSVLRSYKEDNWGDRASSVRESMKRRLQNVKLKNPDCQKPSLGNG
jgi:hypothetical protein